MHTYGVGQKKNRFKLMNLCCVLLGIMHSFIMVIWNDSGGV